MTAEEHYKEVVKLDMDKFDKKAPKFDYYDLLDFAESYYKKQLTLSGVNTRELPPWVRPLVTIITMSLVTVYVIYKTFYVC